MELYTETLPASLPSTNITGAISAFVHAHMCECVLILPSGFAKETLLEDRSTSCYDTEKPQRLEGDSGWYSRERVAIQRDMDRLDRWVCENLMKFNKVKCQGQGNPKHGHRLGHEWIESGPAQKGLQVLVVEILNMSLHHAPAESQVVSWAASRAVWPAG